MCFSRGCSRWPGAQCCVAPARGKAVWSEPVQWRAPNILYRLNIDNEEPSRSCYAGAQFWAQLLNFEFYCYYSSAIKMQISDGFFSILVKMWDATNLSSQYSQWRLRRCVAKETALMSVCGTAMHTRQTRRNK